MLVVETDGRFRFVTQPAHADLAGRFADHWGNEAFDSPTPVAPLRIAAYTHDTGWWRYDRRPHLAADGRPVEFRSMPATTWIDIYETGIETVAGIDAYAGLLVSMHGAGLRRRRYGLSTSWPATPPAYESFVGREEARQARLAAELEARGRVSPADVELLDTLHETGGPPEGTTRVWRNYKLLQAWDALSLVACLTDAPGATSSVAAVPRDETDDVTLSVEAVDSTTFRVEPYPFDVEPLTATVRSRSVAADAFDDEQSLVRAYYRAEQEQRRYTVRAGSPA